MTRKRVAIGNWKKNGLVGDLPAVAEIPDTAKAAACEVVMCLPATLIRPARNLTSIEFGGQDRHAEAPGAHTGDILAPMLRDAGAGWLILGHSERRNGQNETDAIVASKVQAVWEARLKAILCIGASEAQDRAGKTPDVLGAQLAGSLPAGATPGNTVIAYEPIWAIGTGLTPSPEEDAHTHAFFRAH